MKIQRVWKGTQDGFDIEKFNKSAFRKNPVLLLFKTEFGKTFGGFTSIKNNDGDGFVKDDKAFIFSLSQEKIFPLIEPEHAIY